MKIILGTKRQRTVGSVIMWLIVVALVIVVATIVIVKIIQFCQKYLPTNPPPPPPPNTNGANITGEIAYLEPYEHVSPWNTAYPFDLGTNVVTNYWDVTLNYGVTNLGTSNGVWLQVTGAWPDPGVALPPTTLSAAVSQELTSLGYSYTNIVTQYESNGAADFVDASADPTCTNLVIIWRADNPLMMDAVPVCTNTITDTGTYQWTDFYAPSSNAFYAALNTNGSARWSKIYGN